MVKTPPPPLHIMDEGLFHAHVKQRLNTKKETKSTLYEEATSGIKMDSRLPFCTAQARERHQTAAAAGTVETILSYRRRMDGKHRYRHHTHIMVRAN